MARDNILKSALRGLIPTAVLPEADLAPIAQDTFRMESEVALAAGAAVVERCIAVARRPFQIVSVIASPQAAVTANDTDFFTVILNKRPVGAPGTPAVALSAPATVTAGTGNWVAFTTKDLSSFLSATLANRVFAVGDGLWCTVTKTGGTGLVYPVCTITVVTERLSD